MRIQITRVTAGVQRQRQHACFFCFFCVSAYVRPLPPFPSLSLHHVYVCLVRLPGNEDTASSHVVSLSPSSGAVNPGTNDPLQMLAQTGIIKPTRCALDAPFPQ